MPRRDVSGFRCGVILFQLRRWNVSEHCRIAVVHNLRPGLLLIHYWVILFDHLFRLQFGKILFIWGELLHKLRPGDISGQHGFIELLDLCCGSLLSIECKFVYKLLGGNIPINYRVFELLDLHSRDLFRAGPERVHELFGGLISNERRDLGVHELFSGFISTKHWVLHVHKLCLVFNGNVFPCSGERLQ